MHNLSRRRFLVWTSAGAAGAGLLTLVPRLAGHDEPSPTNARSTVTSAPIVAEPIVAYAHSPANGELSVMAGTSEVIVHDPDLVARLRQLVARAR